MSVPPYFGNSAPAAGAGVVGVGVGVGVVVGVGVGVGVGLAGFAAGAQDASTRDNAITQLSTNQRILLFICSSSYSLSLHGQSIYLTFVEKR